MLVTPGLSSPPRRLCNVWPRLFCARCSIWATSTRPSAWQSASRDHVRYVRYVSGFGLSQGLKRSKWLVRCSLPEDSRKRKQLISSCAGFHTLSLLAPVGERWQKNTKDGKRAKHIESWYLWLPTHLKSKDSCNPWLSKLGDWEKKRLSIAACSEVGKPALLTPASAIAEQCQQLAILMVCRSYPMIIPRLSHVCLTGCLFAPWCPMMPHDAPWCPMYPMFNPCSTHVLSCCRMLPPCSVMHLWRCRWLDCCCLDRLTKILQQQRICQWANNMRQLAWDRMLNCDKLCQTRPKNISKRCLQ